MGRGLVIADPYQQLGDPSRSFNTGPVVLVRTLDLCYIMGHALASTSRCVDAQMAGVIDWTDPRSPFRGCDRFFDVNSNEQQNASGPTVWFVDFFGRNAAPDSTAGKLRQFISSRTVTTQTRGFRMNGPQISRENYCDSQTHAPN